MKLSWKKNLLFVVLVLESTFAFADLMQDFESLGGNDVLLEKAKALNPDQRVFVVQDRIVSRRRRFEFAPEFHTVLGGDNFLVTRGASANVHFHFNPQWSIGLKYSRMFNRLSQDGENLLNDSALNMKGRALVPDADYPMAQSLATIDYYPIYGKFNFFNRGIVHFDVYGLLGGGNLQLASGSTNTWTAGAGMGFWISQHLTSRLELRYQSYTAQRYNGAYAVDLTALGVQVGYLL